MFHHSRPLIPGNEQKLVKKYPKNRKIKKLIFLSIANYIKLLNFEPCIGISKTNELLSKKLLWLFMNFHNLRQVLAQTMDFRENFLVKVGDFSKSQSLWEVVSSSLLVGFGCPDTLGLSSDPHSLISVVFACARLCANHHNSRYKNWFLWKNHIHHPNQRFVPLKMHAMRRYDY